MKRFLSTHIKDFIEFIKTLGNYLCFEEKLFRQLNVSMDQISIPLKPTRIVLCFFQINIILIGSYFFIIFSSLKKLDGTYSVNIRMVKPFIKI